MTFAISLPAVNPPAECAAGAATILAAYAKRPEITASHLNDLLTDLAHLAAERGWDFEREARDALFNCKTERGL